MVHQLEANLSLFGGQTPRPGWRSDPSESPAGAMTGLGVHMIDNLIYLAGPVKRVAAFSKRLLGKSQLDDVTSFILEFESGPLGYIGSTYVIPKICFTSAYGTEANAYSDQEGGKLYFQKKGEDARTEIPVQGGDALALELAEFANCIRGTAKPETDGHAGLQVVAVLEGVIESAQTGRAVDVAALRG
jgi:predicted dehydrogenase